MISQNERVRIRGNSEMKLVKRRGVLKGAAEECDFRMSVIKVASICDKADELTRVPKNWRSAVCGFQLKEEMRRQQCVNLIYSIILEWKEHKLSSGRNIRRLISLGSLSRKL